MSLAPGTTIGGLYVVERLLGEGGMGQVWAARVEGSTDRVALKMLHRAAAAERTRFEREARAAAAVVHPNVRGVRELVEHEGAPVMVMELLDGEGLDRWIAAREQPSVEEAATVLSQIVSAVGAMHAAGVVHRDLKPENVFLVDRDVTRVKVLDFGIAKLADPEGTDASSAATVTSTPIGTPLYMAPEQLLGEPTADDRVDVWAVGVMAYQLFSGVLPTAAENVGQVMKKVLTRDLVPLAALARTVPAELVDVVERALRSSAEARVPLTELLATLGRFCRIAVPRFGAPSTRRAATTDERASAGATLGATAPVTVARHNLPRTPTRFVGRDASLLELGQRVRPGALVTLTGAAGSGKTRLAIEAARAALDAHAGGAWFVDLGRTSDAARVEATVVASVPAPGGASLSAWLEAVAARGPMLLVVDNCEHVIEDAAAVVDAILGACPEVCVLATSREPLGVAGEETLAVPPLGVPAADVTVPLEAVLASEAVALFVDRARLADRAFEPDATEARAIAEICRRLDGLPLAIELCAARVRVLGVTELARRIGDHLDLLTGGSRSATPRHKTLRAAIEWSYALLGPEEMRVLRALGVFEGSFGLEAACAVAGRDGSSDGDAKVIDVVSRLVDKSLLVVERRSGGPRFRLLETVRAFSREELERAGELDVIRERHARHFVARAESMAALSKLSIDAVELEVDDLVAADHWVFSRPDGPRRSVALAAGLQKYFQHRGLYGFSRAWLDRVLAAPAALDARSLATALHAAAGVRIFSGDYAGAAPLTGEALRVAREVGDPLLIGSALNILGLVADRTGDLDSAERSYVEALECFKAGGSDSRAATALNNLGDIAFGRGDVALALERQTAALEHARRACDDYLLPVVLAAVALLSACSGRREDGRRHLRDAVAHARRTRAQRAGADALDAALHVAAAEGEHARALSWYAASSALRARIQAPTDDYYLRLHEAAVAAGTAALGHAAAGAATSAGAALDLPAALDEVAAWLAA